MANGKAYIDKKEIVEATLLMPADNKDTMRKNNSFVNFVMDQMRDAEAVSCKRLFSGYAVYCSGKVLSHHPISNARFENIMKMELRV